MQTSEWRFRDTSQDYPELKATTKITNPESLFQQFRSLFENQVKEKFIVFWLNSANIVIGFEVVSEGNLNSSIVHPREVFRGAIVNSCASIIVAHNHPSGNPEPSKEDIEITKKLVDSGKIIGITVFDHLIFVNDRYLSFVERGLM